LITKKQEKIIQLFSTLFIRQFRLVEFVKYYAPLNYRQPFLDIQKDIVRASFYLNAGNIVVTLNLTEHKKRTKVENVNE